jgi:hypothetical protein
MPCRSSHIQLLSMDVYANTFYSPWNIVRDLIICGRSTGVTCGFSVLWAVICVATTRLQINILTAVDPARPISLTLPEPRHHANSRHSQLSPRFPLQIPLRRFSESTQPTQTGIETPIHTLVPNDKRQTIRASSAARKLYDEEKKSTSTSNLMDKKTWKSPSEVEAGT